MASHIIIGRQNSLPILLTSTSLPFIGEKMTKVYGCAEDALTLWALNDHLEQFLNKLNDLSNPEECSVFYRPSFGRNRSPACYGEFDSIVISKIAVYLIEAKWDGSPAPNGWLTIEKNQVNRQKVLKWYLEHWKKGGDWRRFEYENSTAFELELPGFKMPGNGTIVANRLTFLLEKAVGENDNRKPVKDILLFFHQKGEIIPSVDPEWFKVVPIEYKMLPYSDFFELLH
jgi:hypothetical protein